MKGTPAASFYQSPGVGGVGQNPHTFLPWQRRFVRGLARPGVRTAALSVARSNGKSWLAARLAADYLLGGGAERSECVIVASSYMQSKIIYRYAVGMIRDAGHDPANRKAWHYRDGANVALLRSREDGRAIRALGCDPKRAHGRVFGMALLDEPAQWPPGTSEAMLSAIRTGAGKVQGTKIVALGTRPASPGHWFAEWLAGGADYVQCHAARRNDSPFWLRTIRRANPSYDHLPALREDLEAQRREAKGDEGARARYLSLALNLGVPDVAENVLLTPEAWGRCEVETLPERRGPLVVGVDLGGSGGMTAAAGFWPASQRLEAFAVIGGIPDLAERGRRDSVGTLYTTMARRGELVALAGRRVPDYGEFVREILARWGPPSLIVCDRFREAEFRDALDAGRMPRGRPVIVRGMGWKDGGEDVRRFVRAVLERRVSAPESLLLRSAIGEARTVSDVAGNRKLAKRTEGGRRALARDDVAAAAILAVAEADRRGVPGVGGPGLRLVAV